MRFYKLAEKKEAYNIAASDKRQHAPQDGKVDYELLKRRVNAAISALYGAEQDKINQTLGSLFHALYRFNLKKSAAAVNAASMMTERTPAIATINAVGMYLASRQTQAAQRLGATLAKSA